MAYPFQSTGLFGRPSKHSPDRPRRRLSPMRWFWRTPKRITRTNLGHERLVFDPLEPRLLLNADVLSINLVHDLSAPPADHSLIVQLVQQTEQVNNQAVSVQQVQVVDQSNHNAVLAFGDLGEISAVSIAAGSGNTTLTIDAKSFAGQTAPTISFDGGTGQSNVIFDNTSPTNWSLTGQNAGTVSGGGVTATFDHVANLTGAANNNDVLTVGQGGSLTGVFDGGAGGGNSVDFSSFTHQTAAIAIAPHYDTITLDGQAYNYTNVDSTKIGDPTFVDLSGVSNKTITMSSAGSSGINFDASDGSLHMHDIEPVAGQAFDVIVGATNTLNIDSLNISNSVDTNFNNVALHIDGGGDATKVGKAVEVLSNQTLNDTAGITIVAGSITVDQTGTISGSTITLEADASYSQSFSVIDITRLPADASETIDPGHTVAAKIDIEGSITATSTLDVTTNVTITDSIVSTDEILVDALTINSTNQSEITFGALSRVSATSIDATANTTVTATINATNVDAIGSVLAAYTPNLFGTELQVSININNTTTVTVVSGAQLSATSGDITLAALDATNATTTLQLADPPSIPVVGNVLVFGALDSQINPTRVTAVDVGNLSASSRASSGATPTLNATGDVNLSATSGGTISNSEMSKALGTVEINASGNNGDSTSVEIDGVKVQAAGLSLTTESDSNYVVSGLLSSITIGGETDAEVANSVVSVGADGLVVSTEDDSTLSSTATSPDYDASTAALKGTAPLAARIRTLRTRQRAPSSRSATRPR